MTDRRIVLVGIGTGNPEHMTIQAINALNRLDVVLVPRKGQAKADLADVRLEICKRYLTNPDTRIVEFDLPVRDAQNPSYETGVADWHQVIAGNYRDLFAAQADGAKIGLLVWGDPSLYDSTLRILSRVAAMGMRFETEIIPGITSMQALAASHGIALNAIGKPFVVTTGRQLRDGFPDGADTAIVMLDGETSFDTLDGTQFDIHWGARLGMDDETIAAGPLDKMGAVIKDLRAKLRAQHGWVMDIYLLRRKATKQD